jgi:hypothetical protein
MVRIATHNRPSTPRHGVQRIMPRGRRQEMIPVPFISRLFCISGP